MSAMIGNPLLLGPEGYQISRSVRLRSSASAYFNRTPGSAGNRKTWTWSGWVKRGIVNSGDRAIFSVGSNNFVFKTSSSGNEALQIYDYTGSSFNLNLTTSQLFRDPSAWYHMVFAVDTTQATASNRAKLYINGVQVTAFSTATYPSLNADLYFNSTLAHYLGNESGSTSYLDGYLTEINFIDGQALTPSSFGETDAITGVWKPKKYAGTYGTNGFFLNFSDNSSNTATTIGKDYSGNGNNWTPNNISVTAGSTYDSTLDVPTLWADGGNGRGNYAVISPIDKATNIAVAQGNLNVTNSGGGTWASVRGSTAVSSGKWYWEIDQTYSSGGPLIMGIADAAFNVFTQRAGDTAGSYVLAIDGNKGNNGTFSAYAGGSIASGRNIGVALDLDAGTIVFYNNGVSLGTAYSGISGTFFPVVSVYGTQGGTANFNFGQRPFAYTPPTGFKALNTQNLPEPTIKKGNQYFDVVTRSGTGSAASVSSLLFQPNAILTKLRNTGYNWYWADSERGVSKTLSTDTTAAEQTPSPALYTSFDSNGYTLGTNTGSNGLTYTYVDYLWKEGATQGFDIVTYTGTGANRTIAHSLGVAPRMIIVKSRSLARDWLVYHASVGNTGALLLNGTFATDTNVAYWNNTSPTSSVFSVGTTLDGNSNGATYVAYLFAEVAGFSKFGSYTGNGSGDGPFVFLGFRPRWIMIKRTDSSPFSWCVVDTSRSPANTSVNGGMQNLLFPNNSNAEDTGADMCDGLSNGFKLRQGASSFNANGGTYIYACFAENPFKLSLAR